MSGSALKDLHYLYYEVQLCVPDTLQQGFDAVKTYLAVALLVRLLAASRILRPAIMNITCTLLGVWLVWYNHGYIVWYGVALAGTSYAMLATGVSFKAPLLGIFAVMYIVSWYVGVPTCVCVVCMRMCVRTSVCAYVRACVHTCMCAILSMCLHCVRPTSMYLCTSSGVHFLS